MKKFLIGACLLAGGLFLPNDAHADTVYTYTVYSYSAPVHEPYTYEVSVQEIYEYLEMVHGDDFAYDGVLSKSTNGYRAKSACDDCHGDGSRGSGNDNGNGNESVHGNAPDQVVVTGEIIRQVPISIPVYIPTEPAINIGFPTINTSTPIQPPSVYQEEEPVTCTPEMDLLAQQMRKALEESGTTLSEIGGLLFVNADGSLGVSPWVRGEPVTPTTNPVVKIFTAVVPTGATVIGGWHTHPTGPGVMTLPRGPILRPGNISVKMITLLQIRNMLAFETVKR